MARSSTRCSLTYNATHDRRRYLHLARHRDRRQALADDYEVIWIGEGERILPTAIVDAKNRPIPESVVAVDRDGAKSGA
jgi:hypothetical protein